MDIRQPQICLSIQRTFLHQTRHDCRWMPHQIFGSFPFWHCCETEAISRKYLTASHAWIVEVFHKAFNIFLSLSFETFLCFMVAVSFFSKSLPRCVVISVNFPCSFSSWYAFSLREGCNLLTRNCCVACYSVHDWALKSACLKLGTSDIILCSPGYHAPRHSQWSVLAC